MKSLRSMSIGLVGERAGGIDSSAPENPTKGAAGPPIHRQVKCVKAAKCGQIAGSGRNGLAWESADDKDAIPAISYPEGGWLPSTVSDAPYCSAPSWRWPVPCH